LQERSETFQAIGAIWATTAALTGDGDPEQLRVAEVTANFFSVLGVDAVLGRTFVSAEEGSGAPPTIVLGHALWAAA
jgi:hypothetical protein